MKQRILILFSAAIFSLSAFSQQNKNHNFEIAKNLELFNNAYTTLEMAYVDPLSADTLIGWTLKNMLNRLDPCTDFYFS